MHEYIESRDLVGLFEAALASEQVLHDVFLASGPDSGHLLPTAEVIRKYHPKAELRYGRLEPSSPFISMEKSRRLLGFTPSHSWREYGLTEQRLVNRPLSSRVIPGSFRRSSQASTRLPAPPESFRFQPP